jgi:diguanylate cyclase (GGDEF)-like protein
VVGVLELITDGELHAEAQRLVCSILRIYRNFQGLLDYSERDTLTGLLNRKTFDESFLKISSAIPTPISSHDARRTSGPGSRYWLGMIDIDHFKTVNDRYGHLAGDEVIRSAAAVIQSCIREMDVPGRYGGDEFGLLLVHTGTHPALVAAERIRQRLAETVFDRAPDVRCTLSVGIASATRAMEDVHAWISEADSALYQAKTLGRNRIVRL